MFSMSILSIISVLYRSKDRKFFKAVLANSFFEVLNPDLMTHPLTTSKKDLTGIISKKTLPFPAGLSKQPKLTTSN